MLAKPRLSPDFSLRKIVASDHQFLIDLHNDPEVLKNLTDPTPITLASHLSWWEKIQSDQRQLRLIFEIKGVPVGHAKFYDIDVKNRNCVLGGDIHKDHRGRGYAKFMWTLMLDRCFSDMQLQRVGLSTAEYNVVGQRVYLGLGFKEEGRLIRSLYRDGRYHDQITMYMLKSTWDSMKEVT